MVISSRFNPKTVKKEKNENLEYLGWSEEKKEASKDIVIVRHIAQNKIIIYPHQTLNSS